ncbi:MAG TPA: M1 family aminopeptidase [Candidatus Krumholzibacteria bacterium]|nr:M1 family aminopeptidase [Candidatus Krumholzibacteria bacterium]
MLRLSRACFLTLVLLLAGAGLARAQRTDLNALVIGDGAKDCAAAKAALFSSQQPEPLSAASTNIDIHYYHLDLTLPMTTNTLSGTVRVEGTVVGSTMSTLVLDLQNTMTVTAVRLANGTPLVFTHPGAVLNITLPGPVAPGGDVAVDVDYNGAPQSGGFGYFVFGTRNGKRYAWSLSEPYGAREWWPCKDHPSDKADSVRVTVTVPSAYRVGSQGLLVSETVNGPNTTYDWVSHYPISNYLVSVAISEYVRYLTTYTRPAPLAALYGPLSMPLDHLVYDDGSSALPTGWSQASDMIAVYEDWFGPYPFANEKYGHSETTFGGGMEHQTMTSLGGSSISLVSHELGHQWYGDEVTNKSWRHIWLHEGFATYAALLYFQQRENLYPGVYESQFTSTFADARNALGTLVLQDTTNVSDMFAQSRIYSKGSMVLHMLRMMVGDTVFRNIMHAYASDPALQYNVAVTDDFKRVCETESGLNLDTFFSEWVEDGTGYPVYTACSLWLPENGQYRVQTTLHQIQDGSISNVNVFVMPIPIVIHTAGGDITEVVQNTERDQTFTFFVADAPTSVEVDPDKHVLRADVIGSGNCVPVGTGVGGTPPLRNDIVAIYPNPAARRLTVSYVSEGGAVELGVFDVAGRRVLSKSMSRVAGTGTALFDTSSLPAGVYFLRMRVPQGEAITRKFVVVR